MLTSRIALATITKARSITWFDVISTNLQEPPVLQYSRRPMVTDYHRMIRLFLCLKTNNNAIINIESTIAED